MCIRDSKQKEHFSRAGKDIESVRDPFIFYDAEKTIAELVQLTGIQSEKDVVKELNARAPSLESEIAVNTAWFSRIASEAITFYCERTLFFMTDHEYKDSIVEALGEDGFKAFNDDLLKLLDKMVAGEASNSILIVKKSLEDVGKPYEEPPLPYKEKYYMRFARMIEQFRQSLKNTS